MDEEVKNEQVEPTGREALLAAYKASNPESAEPDDNSLHDFSNKRYSELEGRYNDLNGANTRLAELVSKDPKLGAVLSMIAGDKPKSFPYAVAAVYGKEPFDLEGDALDEFEKGYQDHLTQLANSQKEQAQAMKNIAEYNKTLAEYGKENSLSDVQIGEVHSGIMQLADNILMGSIPKELIDMVYKGLNYEKDVQEAADTGFVEGKNTVAEAKMKEKTQQNSVPDFGKGTGQGSTPKRSPSRKGSFYDAFQEEKV